MQRGLTLWLARLETFSSKFYYLPLVGLLAALDMFIFVIPTDAMLVSSVLLQPTRWLISAFAVSFGSTLGAWIMGEMVRVYGALAMQNWLGVEMGSAHMVELASFLDQWGPLGLFLMSVGPLPLAPAVLIAAIGGVEGGTLFGYVFLGRFVKYLLFAMAARYFPKWIKKWTGLWGDVEDILNKKKEQEVKLKLESGAKE